MNYALRLADEYEAAADAAREARVALAAAERRLKIAAERMLKYFERNTRPTHTGSGIVPTVTSATETRS